MTHDSTRPDQLTRPLGEPPAADGKPPVPVLSGLRSWLWPSLGAALAYWLAGRLSLLLAIPPGYASPIYPAAGIALAVVLVYGWRALPGILLGSAVMNASVSAPSEAAKGLALAMPLISALGATTQAALGAWLMRRRHPGPLQLAEPREVASFFLLGAALACTLNATLSTLCLSAAGAVPPEARAFTWWTWWGGDTLGVLIGTPIALTLIGQPRAEWAARRIPVALPLLLTTALLVAGTLLVARWDTQRARNLFDGDAAAASASMSAHLNQALYALEALHGLHIGSEVVDQAEMQLASAPWLALPINLQALGYSQRIPRRSIAAFEAAVSRESGQPYRVFERSPLAAQDDDVVAIRHLEPRAGNATALGVNAMSITAARDAIQRAVNSDAPAATDGFRLTQESGNQTGVVIYRALYRRGPGLPPPAQATERQLAFSAVVFVTLRMQQSAEAAMREVPPYLAWCLLDSRPGSPQPHLAGPTGCEASPPKGLVQVRKIDLGGRQWALRLSADPAAVPDAGYVNAWLFSSAGLLATAMLAALLLTVTGRTRRIEAAVAARTQDLQREVLERQRTEAALRESEQRFRSIVDHAPVGMAFADLQGRLREANPKLREMLGFGAEALSAQSIGELAHEDDRAAIELDLRRLLRDELPEMQRHTRLRHRDGQTLWVRTHWSLLRGPVAGQDRLVAVIEDITEQAKREEAEQGRQRAEAANQAKNDFLSRMSHELRTPLNAMLGFAQLLDLDRQPAPAPHQKGWIAQILKAGWHLLEMINDTLDLSRIDAGMMRLSLGPVALDPLVAHCMAMAGPAAAQRQLALQVQLDAGAGHVLGDETRIKQVISNLLSNAIKYNQPGGRVALSSHRLPGQRLQIRVLDTGLGLTPSQQAELFQPFNRLGREASQTEGTGIGLVISRRLAELMGGDLQVESRAGQGCTFVFTLPLAEPTADTLPLANPPSPAAPAGRAYKVHYIEDNETNVEVMRGVLGLRPQVALTVSVLGLDGLQAVRRERPDVILLDMHLPDVDGLELLHQLQRDSDLAAIPVVVVSADATAGRMAQVLAAGARHYLTKPVELLPFLAVLDALLDARPSQLG